MKFVPLSDTSVQVQTQVRLLRNQPNVRKYMYTSHEISEDEHRRWLMSLSGNELQSVFAVMQDERLVGIVSLNAINRLHQSADWAFYLDSAVQGKGLGSRVEFWMLDHAFNEAGLEKLNCEVLATNSAVIRMHQKFGFAVEGTRRQNISKDGVRIDVALLGITREEWAAKRPDMLAVISRLER